MCPPYLDITASDAYYLHHVRTCVLHVQTSLSKVFSDLGISRQLREHVLHGGPHVRTASSMSRHWSSRMTMFADMSKLHRERVLWSAPCLDNFVHVRTPAVVLLEAILIYHLQAQT
jgi:hypothetical protein